MDAKATGKMPSTHWLLNHMSPSSPRFVCRPSNPTMTEATTGTESTSLAPFDWHVTSTSADDGSKLHYEPL